MAAKSHANASGIGQSHQRRSLAPPACIKQPPAPLPQAILLEIVGYLMSGNGRTVWLAPRKRTLCRNAAAVGNCDGVWDAKRPTKEEVLARSTLRRVCKEWSVLLGSSQVTTLGLRVPADAQYTTTLGPLVPTFDRLRELIVEGSVSAVLIPQPLLSQHDVTPQATPQQKHIPPLPHQQQQHTPPCHSPLPVFPMAHTHPPSTAEGTVPFSSRMSSPPPPTNLDISHRRVSPTPAASSSMSHLGGGGGGGVVMGGAVRRVPLPVTVVVSSVGPQDSHGAGLRGCGGSRGCGGNGGDSGGGGGGGGATGVRQEATHTDIYSNSSPTHAYTQLAFSPTHTYPYPHPSPSTCTMPALSRFAVAFGGAVVEVVFVGDDVCAWLTDDAVATALRCVGPTLRKMVLATCHLLEDPLAVLKEDASIAEGLMDVVMDGCWTASIDGLLSVVTQRQHLRIDLLEHDFTFGELAQVVILNGRHRGNWVDCRIVAKFWADDIDDEQRPPGPDTLGQRRYHILVLPTKEYDDGVGFSGQLALGIARHHLRGKCSCRRVKPV